MLFMQLNHAISPDSDHDHVFSCLLISTESMFIWDYFTKKKEVIVSLHFTLFYIGDQALQKKCDFYAYLTIKLFCFRFYRAQNHSEDLTRSPDTLENLKFVLSSIARIRDMQLEVELRIFDLHERYRTLDMYGAEVCGVWVLLTEMGFLWQFLFLKVINTRVSVHL